MDNLMPPLGGLLFASLGVAPKNSAWKLRAEHRSPRWTTRWDELPTVLAWPFEVVTSKIDIDINFS